MENPYFSTNSTEIRGPLTIQAFLSVWVQKRFSKALLNLKIVYLVLLMTLKTLLRKKTKLSPKGQQQRFFNDYRSINLCNVVYKTCSKVFVNCLKLIMPKVIIALPKCFHLELEL